VNYLATFSEIWLPVKVDPFLSFILGTLVNKEVSSFSNFNLFNLGVNCHSTGCLIKKANFPPNLTFEIRRALNVKFGGKFAFLIGHLVLSGFKLSTRSACFHFDEW
jgi:hypothetical protein